MNIFFEVEFSTLATLHVVNKVHVQMIYHTSELKHYDIIFKEIYSSY